MPEPVEAYIAAHGLDERASGELRSLTPDEQITVMQTPVSAVDRCVIRCESHAVKNNSFFSQL